MNDLLSAIATDPDDDAPRLVYADALQADGDPQGEFITVQCALARMGWDTERLFLDWIGDERVDCSALDDGSFDKLRRREAELFRKHGSKWWKPRAQLDMFRRGLVEHIETDNGQTVDEVMKIAPLARSVRTTASYERYAKTFFASPKLDRIRELWWMGPDAQSLPHFAECRSLHNLKQLIIQGVGRANELTLLASAPVFRNLEVLTLHCYSPGGAALSELFGSPSPSPSKSKSKSSSARPLRELQIVDAQMGAAGVGALASSGVLDPMRVLALRYARLGAGEAMPLFTEGRCRKLEALDLRSNNLSAWDTATIGELPVLRVLDLGNNANLGAPGIEALVSLKRAGLQRLRSLALQKTGLDDHAVKALAGSKLFSRLRSLDLRKNQITDAGIRALVRGEDAKNLRVLYISGNRCGPASKKLLKTALPNTRLYC